MTRAEKYKDTETFHYYNANPKGKIAADCVIRGLCTALEQSWEDTYKELVEIGLKHKLMINEKACYEKYLALKGWKKHKQPRKEDNTKYTGREFCKELMRYDSRIESGEDMHHIFAHIGGHHVVAIISGQVYDHWNSTGGCIGNYWTK